MTRQASKKLAKIADQEGAGPICGRCAEDAGGYYDIVRAGQNALSVWCACCIHEKAFYCHGSEQYYASDAFDVAEINSETYCREHIEGDLILRTIIYLQALETESESN